MTRYNPRLITPPKEEEEIYPYRRAWRSLFVESGLLVGVTLAVFVAVNFLGVNVPAAARLPVNIGLALFPALLWIFFSRVPENRAVEPRRRLLTVFTVTALVANAIGVPLLERLLRPEDWLPFQSTVIRIVGYMATVGVTQEFLKYLVIRYIVWPNYIRTRRDAVAYGAAGAVAYAMVLGLNYVLAQPNAALDIVAMRVFALTSMNVVASLIVAFGFSETLFSDAAALLLPAMLVLAAALVGVAIPLRSDFMVAPVSLSASAQNELFGLAFSLVIFFAPLAAMFFLFSTTERREQAKLESQEI